LRNWGAATAFVVGLATSSAYASTYSLDFTGTASGGYTFDVSATVTATPDLNAPSGGLDITSITGTDTVISSAGTNVYNIQSSDGSGLVGVIPGTPPNQGTYYASSGQGWYYNDVLYPSGPQFVDINGPLFGDSNGNVLNLYWNGGYYLSVDNPGGALWNPGDPGTLSVSPTPLPSSWSMLFPALLGLGFFAYRSRKTDRAVRIAV
jgi:hypothetical protein